MTEIQNDRQYVIDLLRIISMFMIVVLHITSVGGVLKHAKSDVEYMLLEFIRVMTYCCVNSYALISGFVGYSSGYKKNRGGKYLNIWIQVVFYGLLMSTILKVIGCTNVSTIQIVNTLLPITTNQYWYFTAYTALFFLMPCLNRLVENSDAGGTRFFAGVLTVVIFYDITLGNLGGDPVLLNNGYSFVWLSMLYILGAFIKKSFHVIKYNSRVIFGFYWILLFLTWTWTIVIGVITKLILGKSVGDNIFTSYTSPTILGCSCCLLIGFANVHIPDNVKKVIRFFAPATFGVYLIHTQPLVFETFIVERFSWIAEFPLVIIPFIIIGISSAILLLGLFVDKIRGFLFEKIHIYGATYKIATVFEVLLEWWGEQLENMWRKIRG